MCAGKPVKIHKSFNEQVKQLQAKGLDVTDIAKVEWVLSRVNYYHLRGYYIDLLQPDVDRFKPGVTFDQIMERFLADDRLRQVLLPYLRSVEFAVRVACSYALSSRYGALGYLDCENFANKMHHKEFLVSVREAINRSREPFVQTHKKHYGGKYPIWVVIELLSFGTVSKLYKNMLPKEQKVAAKLLGFQYDALENLLQTLVVLRNITAHHARLYGRRVACQYPIQKVYLEFLAQNEPGFRLYYSSVFAAILGMACLLPVSERARLVTEIRQTVAGNPNYRLTKLGFPCLWADLLNPTPDLLNPITAQL